MVRRLLFTSVALAPVVILVHYLFHPSETVDFVLAAAADPARVADRRGDRARGGAHGAGDRRLPERDLRERAWS